MGLTALALTGLTFAQDAAVEPSEAPPVSSEETKSDSSYTFGFQMGQQLNGYGIQVGDIDSESLLKGFNAGVKGDEPELSPERVKAAMEAVADMVDKREEVIAEKNLEEGKKFLEENGKREGVTTTESGLQYEILEKGGEDIYVEPKEGDPIKLFMVNYKGTLIDGTEFDASPEGSPVGMHLTPIPGLPQNLQIIPIPGFQEAMKTMPVGAKWKIFIPSELAYRDQRRSAEIAPNSVLIFELELLEIKDAPSAPEGGGVQAPEGD